MSVIINVVLPLFCIIGCGMASVRLNTFDSTVANSLNRYVVYFALPAALFLGTAKRPVGELLNVPFGGAFLGSTMIVFLLGAFLGRAIRKENGAIYCLQGFTACFANTAFMGIPLFLAAFGPDRVAPAIISTVMVSIIFIGVVVAWLELAENRGHSPILVVRQVAASLASNPLIIAPAVGIAWSAFVGPDNLPKPLVSFCFLAGGAAGPTALFAIGISLAKQKGSLNLPEVLWLTLLKLVVHPILAWVLILAFFPLDKEWATATILLAALPSGSMPYVIASRYGIFVERSSSAILVSTVASVLTLSVVMTLVF